MTTSKSISGVSESASKEREVHDHPRPVGASKRSSSQWRSQQEILPAVAVKELEAVADSLGRKVDVQYDTTSGLVIFSVYDKDGKELIRRIPADEAIRMAQMMKEHRSLHVSDVL